MNALNIKICIYNSRNKVVYSSRIDSFQTLAYRHEMLDGFRLLDLTRELELFIDSGAKSDRQDHALYCTYVKFGTAHQQREDFVVEFQRL
ncbi:MAG: hypothetical protein ACRBBW_11915 [Cellvibrionaceae bacterium]